MTMSKIEHPQVVARSEWRAARKGLLTKEKAFTRQRDALSAARRALPWVRVEKAYVFDAPSGKETLAGLCGGRSQLIVQHFMFGPGWAEGCPSCSFRFYQDATGDIFHTYSCYARGNDILIGTYNYLDLVPKGRDEDALAFTMAWVRHHDRYGDGYRVDPQAQYVPPKGSDSLCDACADHA